MFFSMSAFQVKTSYPFFTDPFINLFLESNSGNRFLLGSSFQKIPILGSVPVREKIFCFQNRETNILN